MKGCQVCTDNINIIAIVDLNNWILIGIIFLEQSLKIFHLSLPDC